MRRRPKWAGRARAVKTVLDGFEFDSKTEADRYAHLLLLVQAGELLRVDPHPEKFRVADKGAWYEPDFRLILPDLTIAFEEVSSKGRNSAKMDYSRSRTAWKTAASLNPCYSWRWVVRDGKGWSVESYKP